MTVKICVVLLIAATRIRNISSTCIRDDSNPSTLICSRAEAIEMDNLDDAIHKANYSTVQFIESALLEINEDMFGGFVNMIVLDLSSSQLEIIHNNTFRNNKELYDLNLGNNSVKELYKDNFYGMSKTRYLDLQSNKIEKLDSDTFAHLLSLAILNLNGNRLTVVEQFVFSGLNSLNYLYLSYNLIKTLDEFILFDLRSLKQLNLNHNKIRTIQEETFRRSPNLTKLYLGNNEIEHLSPETFKNLENLKDLKLNDNNISILKPHLFSHAQNLEGLYLDNNRITKIENAFSGLERLNYLNLTNNQIGEISNGTFQPCTKLNQIFLSNNNISSISNGSFSHQNLLVELHLSNNRIKVLNNDIFPQENILKYMDLSYNDLNDDQDPDAFNQLQNLLELSLVANQFERYNITAVFSHLPKLNKLDISGNKFDCQWLTLVSYEAVFNQTVVKNGDVINLSVTNVDGVSCTVYKIGGPESFTPPVSSTPPPVEIVTTDIFDATIFAPVNNKRILLLRKPTKPQTTALQIVIYLGCALAGFIISVGAVVCAFRYFSKGKTEVFKTNGARRIDDRSYEPSITHTRGGPKFGPPQPAPLFGPPCPSPISNMASSRELPPIPVQTHSFPDESHRYDHHYEEVEDNNTTYLLMHDTP